MAASSGAAARPASRRRAASQTRPMQAAIEPQSRSGLPIAIRPTTPCVESAQRYQIGSASKIQVSGRDAIVDEPCTSQLKVAM